VDFFFNHQVIQSINLGKKTVFKRHLATLLLPPSIRTFFTTFKTHWIHLLQKFSF